VGRRDEIDESLAKHFAWTFVLPGHAPQLADRLRAVEESRAAQASAQLEPSIDLSDAAPTPPIDEEANRRFRERASASCRPLAAAVADAWAFEDEEAALRAVKRLLSRAERIGAEIVAMDEHPLEAVRLLRLLARHGARLSRRQRERAGTVARFMPLDHPELSELFVDVARGAHRELCDALLDDEEWVPEVGDEDALLARLADVIDAGPTHACRAIAIELAARFGVREPVTAVLRRALSLPSFGVRARALHALASALPCAVEEGDLVAVLRDLVEHAPPDGFDDERELDERILAEAAIEALKHVRPDEAEETLLDLIDAEHDSLWLDAGWATEALAAAFPDTAATMVDHWLTCARVHERMRALGALERLPDELAQPRLTVAATDPALMLRDAARRQWLQRFGRACPVGVADLPGAALLAGPPSDRFVARLAVVHGRIAQARDAMARALLAEAPDPEALLLLLQLVGDDSWSGEPRATSLDADWAVKIVRGFGALGVEGLCALASRFPEPEIVGWMRRLGDLVERGIIPREHAEPLRALAARRVATEELGPVDDALRVLELVGPPPELLDRALAIALDDDLGSPEARRLVIAWPGHRALDTRLASEMALALAERDWSRLQHAAWMALERGAPAARVIAQRVIELADHDPEAVDAASECARQLRKAGLLDDGWAQAALARPESPSFIVAARAWRRSPAVRGALEAALGSRSRGCVSAVEAAIALLYDDPPLSPRDRRLVAVLVAAEPVPRAELAAAMCMQGGSLGVLAPHLEQLFTSSDPAVTSTMVGVAYGLRSPKGKALLRAVLPRVVDGELRADIDEALGTPATPYWAEG
jgi:hypothetical protein